MFQEIFVDRKFRVPRKWSNAELAKFAPLFSGAVVNVSAWKDEDKQGGRYRDYFPNAHSYHLTNFKSEARGFQGQSNEIFLDLSSPVPASLKGRFDCVFNHTTLEHVFELDIAFSNLCEMSRDVVIVVAPFLQQMHARYGDFWRFSPTCLQRLFERNGLKVLYTSYNNHFMASVYIFMIASKNPDKWVEKIPSNSDQSGTVPFTARPLIPDPFDHFVGCNAVPSVLSGAAAAVRSLITGKGQGREEPG